MSFFKLILILFLLIAFNQTVISQQTKADSLFQLLKTAKHDTIKLKIFNEISKFYSRNSEPKKALQYAQKAIQLSEKIISSGNEKLITSAKQSLAGSYNSIGIIHRNQSDFKQAKSFYLKALKLYEELEDKEGVADEWNNLGNISGDEGDYTNSLKFLNKALVLREQVLEEQKKNSEISEFKLNHLKNKIAASHNNIGTVYYMLGDYDKANAAFFKALKISEEINDKIYIAAMCNNIAEILRIKGEKDKALDFFYKSLTIYKQLNDNDGISDVFSNIGLIYYEKKDFKKAMEYYLLVLDISEKSGDKQSIAFSYKLIGMLYSDMANQYFNNGNHAKAMVDYTQSIKFYLKSLKINEEIGDKNGVATTLSYIGQLYLKQGKIALAKEYLLKSLNIAKELNSKHDLKDIYKAISETDSANTHFKEAYEYYKLYTTFKDSLFNEESNKQITEMNTKYETEKKQQQIEIQDLQIGQQTLELNKKQIIIYAVFGGLILVLSLVVIVFRSYRQKKKANQLITLKNAELEQANEEITAQRDEIEAQRDRLGEQNEILAEQKKEITDSINYAKHIQHAILPDMENLGFRNSEEGNQFATLTSNLKLQTSNIFVFFKPKDIVSGDFYWASKINDWLIVTVADCTGHGVPGAFMSMLGVSFLNEIVRKKEITKASEVLDKLRDSIIDALQQKGQSDEQKDGMDMSLIAINTQDSSPKSQIPSSKLQDPESVIARNEAISEPQTSNVFEAQWAGANNPLYIVRNPKNLSGLQDLTGLEEVKPDKQPVAICENIKPFTNHEIQLYKGDIIYLVSDGYEDQFGGTKYKKFMSKQLKELFVNICEKPMSEQKQILETTFINWKGENEQIDDVTILGMKI